MIPVSRPSVGQEELEEIRKVFDTSLEIVPLRIVFQHSHAERLVKRMSGYIEVNRTWFRKPVICCPEGPESMGYRYGSCSVAEEISKNIVNWPCVLSHGWESEILSLFKKAINGSK